jgi:hypothetical protein
MCEQLAKAMERNSGLGHTKDSQQRSQGTQRFFTPSDKIMFDGILTFWGKLKSSATDSELPGGAFITVARSKESRVKYAATPTSVGLVVTTGTLERLLMLSTSVITGVIYKDNEEVDVYSCEQASSYSRYSTHSPDFLRVADVLRYFNENDMGLMEISLDGVSTDFKSYDSFFDSYNYYSMEKEEEVERRMYPMLSDRYQPESWNHYCTHDASSRSV